MKLYYSKSTINDYTNAFTVAYARVLFSSNIHTTNFEQAYYTAKSIIMEYYK
jgi:hypothetical protein